MSSLSVDVADGDSDVLPEYNSKIGRIDRHGTSCAGVIAMAKDNDYCGVGVAYDVRLVGKYKCDLILLGVSHLNKVLYTYINVQGNRQRF